jgi:hypothetical protein
MTGYIRNLEQKADFLLQIFPVIIIIGVRQCGKTTLVKKLRPHWKYFDLERLADFESITSDFSLFFKENPKNIIIDEAQLSPRLFSELKTVIDENRTDKGRFILTGSSSFELLKNVSESLAGRVAVIELGTLKMNEILGSPLTDFYQIFKNKLDSDTITFIKSLKIISNYDSIQNIFLRGGYPEPLLQYDPLFYKEWMENYFQSYVQRDIKRLFPKLNDIRYRRFLSMLASLSGNMINRSELGRSLDVSEPTIKEYLDIAHGSFIWRNIPSYQSSVSRSIMKMPKGIFRDAGLKHFLLKIHDREDLFRSPFMGGSFEAFIIEELIKGVQSLPGVIADFYYYRTKNGAEVDLILEGSFGALPVEIKAGMETDKKKLFSLGRFIEENHLSFGLVINNSDEVRLITEKIIQIPAGLL